MTHDQFIDWVQTHLRRGWTPEEISGRLPLELPDDAHMRAGTDLYSTVEEKAANLLYLVVKDHPLSDGNKRSGAALFVTFLAHNDLLNDPSGIQRITNNALAAITLMVAMSDPTEKELMIALLIRMLTEKAA